VTDDDVARLAEQVDTLVAELDALRAGLRPGAHAGLTAEEQATLLAGLLERARASRRRMDGVCARLGEAALDRGASPRMLDWADGRDRE
jgi:hypothetical protein